MHQRGVQRSMVVLECVDADARDPPVVVEPHGEHEALEPRVEQSARLEIVLRLRCVDERVIYNLRYRRRSPPAMRVGRELRLALHDVEAWEQSQREVLTDA